MASHGISEDYIASQPGHADTTMNLIMKSED